MLDRALEDYRHAFAAKSHRVFVPEISAMGLSMDTSFQHPVAISQVMVNFAARYGVDAQTCLLGTGITAVFFVTELASNNHIARMCDAVANEPASRIHRSAECQRLYQHRAAYRQRLESAEGEFD